jgi:hypothetical protein
MEILRLIETQLASDNPDDPTIGFVVIPTEEFADQGWNNATDVERILDNAGLTFLIREWGIDDDNTFFVDESPDQRRRASQSIWEKLLPGAPKLRKDYLEEIIEGEHIVVEHSPPSLESFGKLFGAGGAVAVGAYIGTSVSSGSLLFVTVPFGMIIVGAAAGISTALEAGLREKILEWLRRKKKKTPPKGGTKRQILATEQSNEATKSQPRSA